MSCCSIKRNLMKPMVERPDNATVAVAVSSASGFSRNFYNSVFCRAFERQYFHNAFIFVESTLEERTLVPIEHVYQSYFPVYQGFTQTLEQLFLDLGLGDTFENLKHDVEQLRATFCNVL